MFRRLGVDLGTYPALVPHSNQLPRRHHKSTNSTAEMPLLSLPFEILLEIIREALATPASAAASCCDDFRPTRTLISPNTTSLAHTCQRLRDLTLPFMYRSLTALPEFTPALHALLESDADIARYARQLTVFTTDARGAQLLHGILKRCTRLQDLRIDGSHATEQFTAPLLAHVCPQPLNALGLRSLEWSQISQYLSAAPRELHTVRIEDPIANHPTAGNISQHESGLINSDPTAALASPSLPGVRRLICETAYSTSPEFVEWLARMMQNVQVLDVRIGDCTLSMLKCYVKLGTRLTELTVHWWGMPGVELCTTVTALAPSLRRFVAHGVAMCHLLFDADWGCVEDFEVLFRAGCEGVQLGVLREALVKLVYVTPSARVLVKEERGVDLVRRCGGVGDVAALDQFTCLEEEEWECSFGLLD